MESTLREYKIPAKAIADFFDCYFHIPLPIVTKHELGLPFPLGFNLPIKFGTNPSTIFLDIMVIDRQTHRHTHTHTHTHAHTYTHTHTHKSTPVKTYSLAFAGITKYNITGTNLYSYNECT